MQTEEIIVLPKFRWEIIILIEVLQHLLQASNFVV